jgi:hypothetical protein
MDLDALVGEWKVEATHVDAGSGSGHTTIERLGAFVVQRSVTGRPDFPDSVSIIGATGPDGALQMNYFDERGVARVYEMALADGAWTLLRMSDDPFPQRFTGLFENGGRTIAGRWERQEGDDWLPDLEMTYTAVS